MDSAAAKSNVLAGVRDGVPFDCPAFLNGIPSGAAVSDVFPAIDAKISFLTIDTVTALALQAQ